MKKSFVFLLLTFFIYGAHAQLKWVNLDSLYQPLPTSMHIYKSTDSLDEKPNVMYYAIADLKDKNLKFTSDTTMNRRLTPSGFYYKNNKPLLVVNCSFFSFATHQNLNIIVKNGKILSYNEQTIPGKGKDTLFYAHPFFGAIGITKKRNADVAWIYSDSSKRFLYASQLPVPFIHDSVSNLSWNYVNKMTSTVSGDYSGKHFASSSSFKKWRMNTAVGGGPVLVQNGEIKITNNEEMKFSGKAINDRHPRTAIGYTKDNQLIILVCEGRSETAAGLTLTQEAKILKDLGCVEALNLDGGGSSCMLINGKETNTPSSKGVQREVPSVFLIFDDTRF
ncbi:MAG: phosphodiester glycosidase family protein [Ginsengibacter sp.]